MKSFRPFIVKSPMKTFLAFVFAFISLTGFAQTMSGTYTVTGTSDFGNREFETLQEAANYLVSQGISGAVTINVDPATYNEQMVLDAVTGTGPGNTITFQPSDSANTLLAWDGYSSTAGTNFMILINGADYVTIQKFRFDATGGEANYGRVIQVKNNSDHVTIRNNYIQGKEGAYNDYKVLIYAIETTDAIANDYLVVENNVLIDGEMACSIEGDGTDDYAQGVEVRNNTCTDQYDMAFNLRYLDAPVVDSNYITNDVYNGAGIELLYINDAAQVTNNRMELLNPSRGLYYYYNDGTSGSNMVLIANNFVTLKTADGSRYGIHLNDVDDIRVYHNSVNITNATESTGTSALIIDNSSSSNIDLRNNIFANFTGGYAYYVRYNSSVSASDYNDYFTTGNYLASWDGTITPSLSDLQSYNFKDANSLSVNPIFTSGADLHTTTFRLESKGDNTILSAVPRDIDGQDRGATPDIGADEFTGAGVALTGIKTVYGGGDFASLEEAVDSLNEVGIDGDVSFYIRDDNSPYSQQIEILPVSGADAGNRVTFMPDPGNSVDVVITHNATSDKNYTILLQRASYIDFKDLTVNATNSTYSTVFWLRGMSSNDSIVGCELNSTTPNSDYACIYSSGSLTEGLHVHGCTLNEGNYGIGLDGPGTDTEKPGNITILNNTFDGHYEAAIRLSDCSAPLIEGNTISHGASTYYYWGIELYHCIKDYRILGNKVLVNKTEGGIYIDNSDANTTYRGKIVNNFVGVSGAGSTSMDGIYTDNSDYIDIFFNTVHIAKDNTSTGSHAFYNYNGAHLAVKNNNFVDFGPGYAYYTNSTTAMDESDYNNLFSAGQNLAYWNGNMPRMSDLLLANGGKETHSYNIAASFLNEEDPDMDSPFLDTAGIDLAPDFTDDFYDQPRGSSPSVGAYEYTASVSPILGGTYAIGSGEDYETILAAFTDLQAKGISGPVVFEINTGDYNELIGKVFKIPGSSEANTVTLTSASGNPEDVTIFYATDNADARNIFDFIGVDNIILKNLTITSTGQDYGRPLSFTGTFENVTVENNLLASANDYNSVLLIQGNSDDVTIKNNTITNGSTGIYFEGINSATFYSTNSLVTGNHISGAYYSGIEMRYHFEPQVIGNTIENNLYGGFLGIYMYYCSEEMLVTGNRIYNDNSDMGIYLYYCDATVPTFHGLVSNNVVHVGGTYTAYGIEVYGCTGTRLYNNSIYLTSTYSSAGSTRGVYTTNNNTEIEIVNNSVYNSGMGYAFYVDDANDILTSDYNNWYSDGANLVRWSGTDYATLSAFLAAVSGMDEHSVSLNPKFVSTEDLRSGQPGLHKKALVLTDVEVDIDSLDRDPVEPDIGAYEFVCVTPTFDVTVSTSCLGDSTLFIDNSTGIAPGSTLGYNFTGGGSPSVFATSQDDTLKNVFATDGLQPVSYFVFQIAGCKDTLEFNVEILPHPELEITTQGAYCDTDDGYAKAEVTNGEGPFNYFWSTGETTDSIGGLALGTYTVAVNDTNGCSTTQDVVINEAIQVTVTQLSPSTCGAADGSAEVSATGGFTPYTYVWSNGDTSKINTSLTAGFHYVNVIDAQGCYAQGSITLANDGSGPQIQDATVTSNDCYGDKLGAIDITVSGGTGSYTIKWSNGETSEDIDSLAAGIYNVEVYDAEGCLGAASFEVTQPTKISVDPVVEDATCGGSDGSAVAVVSGGTKPYVYAWETGGIFQIEQGLEAGVYSVTVTDANGCVHVEPVLVSNENAPVVSITSVQGTGCNVTDNGAIDISVSGGIPPLTFAWSGPSAYSSANEDISGLSPGYYEVEVSDFNGCIGVAGTEIMQEPPAVTDICLVTVDSVTQRNMVVWQKQVTTDISHYNIYRESSVKGSYQLIGSRHVDSLSYFVDTLADPTVRSWRYRISAVDECGYESELSDPHKTIHLTMNIGLNDDINLIWDNYEGFDVTTYDIYKYLPATNWVNLTDIAAGNTSYTDANVTSVDVLYYIQVDAPGTCDADLKAATYNSSRSNRKSKQQGTGIESLIDLSRLNIYPNPSSGIFNLSMELEGMESIEMRVFDIAGKMIIARKFENVPFSLETQIDLSGYSDGIYQVQLRTGRLLLHRIIIKD